MISCTKSGSQRFLGSDSHPDSILRFHRYPAPWARLGTMGTARAAEIPGRSALVGRAWPAPRNLFAADPASLRNDGLRIPLRESLTRSTAASSPRAPECRARLSGCAAREFPESVADGESDCRAVAGSGRGTGVRKASSHGDVCLAIPDDSMETLDGPGPDNATGRPE